MKRSLALVAAFLLGGGVNALTQSMKDAVEVDPTHHHVILENPRVRVFEVMAAPGDKSPMHSHKPLVAVSLAKARLRMATPDGKSSIFDLHPGQVLWMENVEHSWELLAGEVHLVAVEPKAGH
jgi:quercetin dioxygenase-like cupin family protein